MLLQMTLNKKHVYTAQHMNIEYTLHGLQGKTNAIKGHHQHCLHSGDAG